MMSGKTSLLLLCCFWLVTIPVTESVASKLKSGESTSIANVEPPVYNIVNHLLARPAPEDNILQSIQIGISINYPSIGRTDIDADIRQWVKDVADTFEQYFDEEAVLWQDEDNQDTQQPSVFLQADYTISWPSDKAVSITFELWNYLFGEPNNMDILTLNYSLITGQRLDLADIFEQPEEALQLMSAWSRNDLKHKLNFIRQQMLLDGTSPLKENFSSLTLIPGGIRINFQPYQVTSWEMGTQKVDMPLEELQAAGPLTVLWQR